MKEDFEFKKVKVDVLKLEDLDWLSDEEIKIVEDTLLIIDKQNVLANDVLSTNALSLYVHSENEKTTSITIQNILFDTNIRIEISSLPNDISLFGVRVFYLEEDKGKHYLRILSNLGG